MNHYFLKGEHRLNKIKILILTLILFIISSLFIIINGKTYTVKIENINLRKINSVDELDVRIENDNIVKCVDKKIEDDVLKLKFESISKGKALVDIISKDGINDHIFDLYVHDSGIITYQEYMGDFNGNIIICISITVLLIYILYLLIMSYKKKIKENIYNYKNITYLGMIIFIAFSIIVQLLSLRHFGGIAATIDTILQTSSLAVFLFPIAFIVSILVILSNISLIRKEGFSLRNLLGIILGGFLCVTTILPEILYRTFYSSTWIDIHNQNGVDLYIYEFIENIIYIVVTYIECVLLGTIILGIKSARHIPKFDKDFILILGCQIKKDGSLTNLLKGRVDRAIEFSKMQKEKTGKDIVFIPSGGKGNDEIISEAQAMKDYLIGQGIKEENILMEDKSKNTFENIKFSNKIIKEKKENAKVAFSTTKYHVFRAGCIATSQNVLMEGIGAKTKSYFWVNAFIREFIATLYSEKKKHIVVFFGIMIFVALMLLIIYLNNNI